MFSTKFYHNPVCKVHSLKLSINKYFGKRFSFVLVYLQVIRTNSYASCGWGYANMSVVVESMLLCLKKPTANMADEANFV